MKRPVPTSQPENSHQDEQPVADVSVERQLPDRLSILAFHRATLGARIQFFLRNGRAE